MDPKDFLVDDQLENEIQPYMEDLGSPAQEEKGQQYYAKLRNSFTGWLEKGKIPEAFSDILLLAPDLFYLIWRLSLDRAVPLKQKRKVVYALLYFFSPLDLVPDFSGAIGYLDDIYVVVWTLHGILNQVNPEVLRKYWHGNDDILNVIQMVLSQGDRIMDWIKKIYFPLSGKFKKKS
jgi:uncharacterized membrane protein YkvA (DUF1232 family)